LRDLCNFFWRTYIDPPKLASGRIELETSRRSTLLDLKPIPPDQSKWVVRNLCNSFRKMRKRKLPLIKATRMVILQLSRNLWKNNIMYLLSILRGDCFPVRDGFHVLVNEISTCSSVSIITLKLVPTTLHMR